VQREVDLAAREQSRLGEAGIGHHVADIGETFCPQQPLRDVLRRDAEATALRQPDGGRFRRCFLGK
jgi:hypothetical protein